MVDYTKPWLSLEDQLARLETRGLETGNRDRCLRLPKAVGYYRLTGYLHPFRVSRQTEINGRTVTEVLPDYREGTSLRQVEALIDFDRSLRLTTLEGVERIEISLRMQIGYTLGGVDPFAHTAHDCFTDAFTQAPAVDGEATSAPPLSRHDQWLGTVQKRLRDSDEAFVSHFRDKYDNRMPIWALTEVMELGQLSTMYRGLRNDLATSIAAEYEVPTKKLMTSWIAALNYARNVSAHHARLFNRKLQNAPASPSQGQIPLLDHLKDSPKQFGTYKIPAVMAYLLRVMDPDTHWPSGVVQLVQQFPSSDHLPPESIGVFPGWSELPLWG